MKMKLKWKKWKMKLEKAIQMLENVSKFGVLTNKRILRCIVWFKVPNKNARQNSLWK